MCEIHINQLTLTHPLLGTWPTTQASAQTGNRTGDLLVHRLAFSPLSHTSQGRDNLVYPKTQIRFQKKSSMP